MGQHDDRLCRVILIGSTNFIRGYRRDATGGCSCRYVVYKCRITSPPKVIWEESVALAHLRNRVPTGYNETSQIHPKAAPSPFDDYHPYLIHPSIDRPHSPSQTASGSNQPFSTVHFPDTQTDRQTDRCARRQVYAISAYARYRPIEDQRANNI